MAGRYDLRSEKLLSEDSGTPYLPKCVEGEFSDVGKEFGLVASCSFGGKGYLARPQLGGLGRRKLVSQQSVTSKDGTAIAYWTSGDGPPLVLVHGTPADHTRWRPLLPYLESYTTVHAMDRRGRGGSGDGPEYALEREYEDVAAVVDAVAEASGSAVDVYGHSHGGLCAFGAAMLTSNIHKLVLYEGWPAPNPEALAIPSDVQERMDALLAEGERERALEVFF